VNLPGFPTVRKILFCNFNYITKLCRPHAEVFLNHEGPKAPVICQGGIMHSEDKGFNLGGGQAYDRSANDVSKFVIKLSHILHHKSKKNSMV
jgi:hypothetical protein